MSCTGLTMAGENLSLMVAEGLEVLGEIAADEVQAVSGEPLAALNETLAGLIKTYGLVEVLHSLNDAAVCCAEVKEGDDDDTDVACARMRVFAARIRDAAEAAK